VITDSKPQAKENGSATQTPIVKRERGCDRSSSRHANRHAAAATPDATPFARQLRPIRRPTRKTASRADPLAILDEKMFKGLVHG
jgi:hypothetical protein